jgi:hypothetical protein
VSLLNPTAPERMTDAQGRPYFLWDVDLTLDRFRELLRHPNRGTRAHALGKLLRQAKPDDVFLFVSTGEIRELWTEVEPHLGEAREFWRWLLATWQEQGVA